MSSRKIPTFCRVCEPSCGLVAEVEGEGAAAQIIRLLPDKAHPVTQGYACHKGIASLEIHNDPDRLNFPQKRPDKNKPDLVRLDWDQATSEVAGKIQAIRDNYGPQSLAAYIGNPTAFNSLTSSALSSFLLQTGFRKVFNSGTQDCSNKFAATEAVFGTSTLHPIPDIDNTDFLLIFGENPKISHMSFISIPDPMGKLKAAKKRGAEIRFINPRKIESATAAVGDVVQIKPDTDLYLLAAMLHELDQADRFDKTAILNHGNRVEELRSFIEQYPADRVAAVVGISAADIRQLAHAFADAKSASVHASTGVNMGRQGTLSYWLIYMLSFLTGNLDKEGGNIYSEGFYPAPKTGRTNLETAFFETEFGAMRAIRGSLPANLLPEMIQSEKDPIKAMVVIAGNPILSVGGEAKMREAFSQLELLIVIDLYPNATSECADYLLPATDMLERSDINICGLGMQHEPFVQYTDAVVQPKQERKEDWWILARIEQALGQPNMLDEEEVNPHARTDRMLQKSELSIEKLKSMPSQTAVLRNLEPGKFYSQWIQTPEKRVDCCPSFFSDFLPRAEEIFQELDNESEGQLKLIHLRNNYMHNSWFQNLEKLKRLDHTTNGIYLNAEEAQKRGLQEGVKVSVRNAYGQIETEVRIDDSLRAGVVAMTHGWSEKKSPGLSVTEKFPGANVNQLLPSGPGSYEPLSNQAHMTGIPVEIELVG